MDEPALEEAYQQGYNAEITDNPPKWELALIEEWFKGRDDKCYDLHFQSSFKEQVLAYETGYTDAEAGMVDHPRTTSDKAYLEGVKEFTNNFKSQ